MQTALYWLLGRTATLREVRISSTRIKKGLQTKHTLSAHIHWTQEKRRAERNTTPNSVWLSVPFGVILGIQAHRPAEMTPHLSLAQLRVRPTFRNCALTPPLFLPCQEKRPATFDQVTYLLTALLIRFFCI
jgi:hypothetical protein